MWTLIWTTIKIFFYLGGGGGGGGKGEGTGVQGKNKGGRGSQGDDPHMCHTHCITLFHKNIQVLSKSYILMNFFA